MKKYKLIKEFPGSPKLGSIIKFIPDFIGDTKGLWLCEGKIHPDPTIHPEFWEEIKDNNSFKLEIGKIYKVKYKHCKSPIQIVKITRFTSDGYPWMEGDNFSGIVTSNSYDLIEEVVEKDYEILSFFNNIKEIKTPIAMLKHPEHYHYTDFKSYEAALEKGLQEALKLIK